MEKIGTDVLQLYIKYKGWYDGYRIQNKLSNDSVDKQWNLIDGFIQDIRLVRKGLTDKWFADNLIQRLQDSCQSGEIIRELYKLEIDLANK